jgi:hypothetical protein
MQLRTSGTTIRGDAPFVVCRFISRERKSGESDGFGLLFICVSQARICKAAEGACLTVSISVSASARALPVPLRGGKLRRCEKGALPLMQQSRYICARKKLFLKLCFHPE